LCPRAKGIPLNVSLEVFLIGGFKIDPIGWIMAKPGLIYNGGNPQHIPIWVFGFKIDFPDIPIIPSFYGKGMFDHGGVGSRFRGLPSLGGK
jgi:hypothetical protein